MGLPHLIARSFSVWHVPLVSSKIIHFIWPNKTGWQHKFEFKANLFFAPHRGEGGPDILSHRWCSSLSNSLLRSSSCLLAISARHFSRKLSTPFSITCQSITQQNTTNEKNQNIFDPHFISSSLYSLALHDLYIHLEICATQTIHLRRQMFYGKEGGIRCFAISIHNAKQRE